MRLCGVPGCDEPFDGRGGRGMCGMHYYRWYRQFPNGIPRRTPAERFFRKVVQDGDCWRWTGATWPKGYGSFYAGSGERVHAHRWAYEFLRADIPDGLQVDHLCRNRWCVNPWHLEPVTGAVNFLRGFSPFAVNARKTHCIRGHEFTPENTKTKASGTRECRECIRIHKRNSYARRRAA